jgi:hypothetical protein
VGMGETGGGGGRGGFGNARGCVEPAAAEAENAQGR